nr:SDR family NAD(P)-dependent oxidoreductase [Sphingomonas sp. CDS-1]
MARLLVIGGAGGVGSALVRQRIEQGDTVFATVLNDAEAAAVADAHEDAVPTWRLDLGKADDLREKLAAHLTEMGDIDAVVVCAAISPYGPVETTPLDLFRRTLEINTISGIAIYQAALPVLRRTGGRLVFVSSMAGRAAMPFIGAYVASKFALEGVADVMRREAAVQGVKVVLVEPGGIRTGMVDDQLRTIAEKIKTLSPDEEALYGKNYRQFQALAQASHSNTASTADDVAAIIASALDAFDPDPRYIAGEDAVQLIGLTRSLSDAELDATFAQIYGSAI